MENLFEVNEVKLSYRTKQKASERPKIGNSKATYELLLKCFDDDTIELKESFKILLLNRNYKVLGVMNVSEGGLSSTIVNMRLILQAVILSNASGIILSHNHPSGYLYPSDADDNTTRTIQQACKILDIQLLDHIIVSTESYYSYSDMGRI